MRQGPRHAGPRRHVSWWRGPWPPSLLSMLGFLAVTVGALMLLGGPS
jgi:hypothetical protein